MAAPKKSSSIGSQGTGAVIGPEIRHRVMKQTPATASLALIGNPTARFAFSGLFRDHSGNLRRSQRKDPMEGERHCEFFRGKGNSTHREVRHLNCLMLRRSHGPASGRTGRLLPVNRPGGESGRGLAGADAPSADQQPHDYTRYPCQGSDDQCQEDHLGPGSPAGTWAPRSPPVPGRIQ